MGIFRNLADRAMVKLIGRNHYESARLRAYFKRHYDTEIGLYSYGCFDRWRFPPPNRIGRYCSFATSVRVVEANHPSDAISTHPFLYETRLSPVGRPIGTAPPLIIEDDVWVGHNVTILPGCRFIGRGSIIAAGAVVTADVPAYAIMAGMPARMKRFRFEPDMIAALEASRWWTLSIAELTALEQAQPNLLFQPTADGLRAFSLASPASAR